MAARLPLAALLCALLLGSVSAQTKLLRYPDLHGDRIVFVHGSDLWTVGAAGGTATRLTAHPGRELFPKFSPDGRWIAFTGQYDGDEQVYVIPSQGGVPKQLTYYPARGPLPTRWGFDQQVHGWTPDGKVVFRSMRGGWDLTDTRLYTVAPTGGLPVPLEMPVSGAGDLSPDGKQVVYSPLTRDFRSWKRYRGGWAQDLWIFNRETGSARQITKSRRTERDPMWIGDKIYFASDRTGKLQLYSYALPGAQVTQLTQSPAWDVRWPSKADDARIIFEQGGELAIYDIASAQIRSPKVMVPTDGAAVRPALIDVSGSIEDMGISPDGKRVLFAARGDIFSVPVGDGPTRNLTGDMTDHARAPVWSPDGSTVAFISDRTGEEQIHLVDAMGRTPPTALTTEGRTRRLGPGWSPTGKHIAFSDKDGQLQVATVPEGVITTIANEQGGFLRDWKWSPKGGHIAFAMSEPSGMRSIHVWTAADGKVRRVTGEMSDDFSPAWDPTGDYLYFLARRDYQPQLGMIEWNYLMERGIGVFAVALRKEVAHPFPPKSVEAAIESDADAEEESGGADAEEKADEEAPIAIAWDGLMERVARAPVPSDNYRGLSAVDGHLLYVKVGAGFYGRGSGVSPKLHVFSMKEREQKVLTGSGNYKLAAKGEHVLVSRGGGYHVVPVKFAADASGERVSTSGLKLRRIPAEEFGVIFDEVWRRFRDFFYVSNMHGYDWQAIWNQYRPLLAHVTHRDDLNYIISEMIGELNVGHAYISGGDFEIPDRPQASLIGATFELDRASQRFRIARILPGENEEARLRSPLTEIGVDAREGDFVLAIDGIPLRGDENPYSRLVNRSEGPVHLTLADSADPAEEAIREVSVNPIGAEGDLYYLAMVEERRQRVHELSGGTVGYIHIPDMGANGIREFIKTFYPQIRKEGMVVDVRNNGGGNVSQMLLERLNRKLLGSGIARSSDRVSTYPYAVFHGHLVCILNGNSASDGDIFPYRFRQMGLGKLVGKRSWGGVIGIAGRGPLLDGGDVRVPEFGFMNEKGEWVVENEGVAPDIEVDNDPASVLAGRDPQLEKAVEVVMAQMKADPKKLPTPAAPPVRTK